MMRHPVIRLLADTQYRWLRHVLFIFGGLVLAFKGDIGSGTHFSSEQARNTVLLVDVYSFVFILAMLYLLLQVLIPQLLFKSRVLVFTISFFLLVVVIYFYVWFLDYHFLVPIDNRNNIMHIQLSLMHFVQVGAVCTVLLSSVAGLKVFKKWITDLQRMADLQAFTLKTELEQLKSQVNPHFLFNTLNNLHVLTQTNPQKASQVILGLSDLLRYQLYDSAREQILLSKDIGFMFNLLALEKLRKDDFNYEVHTEGKTDGISLPPFLFIPFVENAIKHGASAAGHSYLTLHFKVTNEQLFFYSENSKPVTRRKSIGGIGLKNIQRRLKLLYPERHTLSVMEDENKYIVNLILPI